MTNSATLIQPWLSVSNSASAGAFYRQAFDATETYRMETPDGGLVLQLSVNGAAFWVSGQSEDADQQPSENARQEVVKLILVVDDPDAVFERAIKAGATEVFPVGEDYGWRLGRLTDPFGIDWEVGRLLTKE